MILNVKTRIHGLSVVEDFVILACDRQTDMDRQMVIPMLASTGLCIASYADAL